MAHNFFLSHYTKDKELAEVIANTLSRISLRQIAPWFSSDSSEMGGLKPGSIWFTEIIGKITQSKALVVVLTPNSVERPWIYFESGIAQSLKDCEIIPVCVGIKRDSIPPPLGLYQCFQLTDYKSLKDFIGKLLVKFDISFDEEMAKSVLENSLSHISKIDFTESQNASKPSNVDDILLDVKNHIDKRFVELIDKQQSNLANKKVNRDEEFTTDNSILYTITINIKLGETIEKQFLEVRTVDTVGDILTNIYFLIKAYVPPYSYLINWILYNPKTDQRLVIKEVGDWIPAKLIFKQEIKWQLNLLKEEYDPKSSIEISKRLK